MIDDLTPMRLDVVQRTGDWLQARNRGGPGNPYPCTVTASNAWKLFDACGVVELWREHVLGEKREVSDEMIAAMQDGIDAEPDIIRTAIDVLGVRGEVEAPVYTLAEMPWLVASLDAVVGDTIIEAKLVGDRSYQQIMARHDVLPRHALQVTVQMLCSGLRYAWVAYRRRLTGTLVLLPVPFCRETAELVTDRARLYCEHVKAQVMPWRLENWRTS